MQSNAVVEGTLKNASGVPQVGFFVEIESVGFADVAHEETVTDQKGHYILQGLRPGDYVIYPYNPAKAYPFTGNTFQSLSPRRVTVPAAEGDVVTDLTLPAKAGLLTLLVIDENSRKPVADASVILCHSNSVRRSARIGTDATGSSFYYVPSGEPISVLIQGAAYEAEQRANIILKPEESRKLVVEVVARAPYSRSGGASARIDGVRCVAP